MKLQVGQPAPRIDARPVFGLPVRSGERPLVVLFLRSLSGGLAQAALVEAERALARVESEGGAMVAFTVCDLPTARDLVPRNHVLIPVVAETDHARFEDWGVARDRGLSRSLLGIVRGLANLRKALAFGPGRPRDVDQLSAEFVIDRNGVLVHAHYAETIWELPDPEALCAALPR